MSRSRSKSPLPLDTMTKQLLRISCVAKHCGEKQLKRATLLLSAAMLGEKLSAKEMKELKELFLNEAYARCTTKHCGKESKSKMEAELKEAKAMLPKTSQGREVAQLMEKSVALQLRVNGHRVPKRRSRSRSRSTSKRTKQRSISKRR